MKRPVAALLVTMVLAAPGCSEYPSPEGKAKPYILKEGCKFTIVDELRKAGVTSPEVSGAEGVTATMSISLDDRSIGVSNCEVVANSHSLPIYER